MKKVINHEKVPRRKILLIDDDPDILAIVKAEIATLPSWSSSPHIVIAENGKEGLEVLKKKKFDLIILDLVMPNIDGLVVLSTLRTTKGINQHKPVIILSGFLPKIEASLSSEILDSVLFLEKPFPTAKLDSFVKMSLSSI